LVDEGCKDQLSDIIEKLAIRQGQVLQQANLEKTPKKYSEN